MFQRNAAKTQPALTLKTLLGAEFGESKETLEQEKAGKGGSVRSHDVKENTLAMPEA